MKKKWFWLRDKKKRPVALVLTTKKDDATFEFSVATHNPLDTFNRQRGVEIAQGRLETSNSRTIKVPFGTQVKKTIVSVIAKNLYYPQRTREAASEWLKSRKDTTGL